MTPRIEQIKVFRINPIRGSVVLAAMLLLCLSVAVSFAQTHGVSSQQLDALSKLQGSYTFAVIGDTRNGGKVYRDLARRIMGYRPAFVVNTGDMVFYSDKFLWGDFWDLSKPITVPYFFTVGNHDVDDKESEDSYKEEVGFPSDKLYYSFTVGNSVFIFLDSNVPGQDRRITGEQYDWLKKTLSTSGKKHKFVFVHHPVYPDKECGRHYGGCLDKYQKERDRLVELLKKNKVTIAFAGHEHFYLRNTVDGLMQIITGGGGAPLYTDENKGGFHHFVLVTVDGDEVRGKAIGSSGKVKDSFQLKEE